MTETTAAIAQGMSAATTGTGTPDTMTVSRPAKEALWAILAALVTSQAAVVGALFIIGSSHLTGTDVPARIEAAKWIASGALFNVGILTIALGSSRLGSVKASAGPIQVDVDGKS